MKLHKLTLSKKQATISAITFLAAMGLILSVFAETAGGANLLDDNKDNRNVSASYKDAGDVFSHVGTDSAGSAAISTAAAVTSDGSVTVTGSSDSTSQTSTTNPQAPSPDPDDPGTGTGTPAPVTVPPTEPSHPCAVCPTPKFTGEGTMIACPDYCIDPNPVPTCPRCGTLPQADTTESLHACPMMMCPMSQSE